MKRARIILVDDHPEILALVVRLLEPEFEVLETFTSAEPMLEAMVPLAPDLVVMDITMPGITGIGAAQQLKAAGSRAKIVFLTVHADEDYAHSAFAAGASGYVVKQQLLSDLIPAMQEALAGRTFVSSSLEGQHL